MVRLKKGCFLSRAVRLCLDYTLELFGEFYSTLISGSYAQDSYLIGLGMLPGHRLFLNSASDSNMQAKVKILLWGHPMISAFHSTFGEQSFCMSVMKSRA